MTCTYNDVIMMCDEDERFPSMMKATRISATLCFYCLRTDLFPCDNRKSYELECLLIVKTAFIKFCFCVKHRAPVGLYSAAERIHFENQFSKQ